MAAPGLLTNIRQDSNISAVTSLSFALDAGTAEKFVGLLLEDDKTADSLTVDTAGWTLGTIVQHVSGPSSQSMVVAYAGASADTSVDFSWTTGAAWAGIGGHAPDIDFDADGIFNQIFQAVSGADPVTPSSATWSPTDPDVRILYFYGMDDATRPLDSGATNAGFCEVDNETEEDSGGAGDPYLVLCSVGVTATSPHAAANDWDFVNSVRGISLIIVLREAAAAVYPPWPRRQTTQVRM